MAVLKTRSGDQWISLAGVKGDTGPAGPTGPTGPASTQIDSTAVTTNSTFFPVFVAGTGTQTPSIRTATTAFSFNPSTSVLTLGGSVVANGITLTGNTGTVTSIATGNGITGGTITTTGTLGLTGQALALHNLATNGIIARTGAGTVAARTITGTTNQVTVTNGDGVSANPTLSLPQDINTAASVQFGSIGIGTAASGTSGEATINQIRFPPTTLGTTGTINIDFAGAAHRTQAALTGNITYTASNYAAGRTVTIRVTNGSTQRTLTFPAGWRFIGVKPANIAANKVGVLTVTSFGTTEADCVAAWSVEP
jgi:hypothetical protein